MQSIGKWQTHVHAKRRLLVLTSKPAGMSPSQRYRLEQWAPYLAAEHGIDLEFAPFESEALAARLYRPGHLLAKSGLTVRDYVRRSAILGRARHFDAIVIHREAALIGPAIYERLLARSGKPIIYDFDDAIWSPGQAWKNGLFSRLHFPGKTASICRLADAVTVGNDYIGNYARRQNDRVFVVPSSIDLSRYPALPEARDGDRLVVSWTGSVSTLVHFEHVRPALEQFAKLRPLKVRVICSDPPSRPIAGAEMEFVRWSADREAADVAKCHVGIMPLPDDEVSRGKGGMKALQFMATGRPVIVSPVGVNCDIVRDGKNGLLAGTVDDWVAALTSVADDPSLRARLGKAARATVELNYGATVSAAEFAKVVNLVLGSKR